MVSRAKVGGSARTLQFEPFLIFFCYLEYLHHYVASKVEARKIYQSARFEEITAKYW